MSQRPRRPVAAVAGAHPTRRAFLTLGAACAGTLAMGLPPSPVRASGGEKAPARSMRLPPMTIQGKDRFSYVRLEAELVVRDGKTLLQDLEKVNLLRPRIIGSLVENLSSERFESHIVTTDQVKWLKSRIRELANTAIGEPLIEDVLVISLLVT